MSVEVRLAKLEDSEEINKLIWSPGVKWFGNIRPKQRGKKTLFHSYQTHRMLAHSRENSTLVAYAEFRNYPSISALPSDCWMEWLSGRYCLTFEISWLNALFCNFCIYKSDYSYVIAEIIKEVFYRENRVWYVIAIRTPNVRQPTHYTETFDDLEKLSKVFYPREYSAEHNCNTQSLYIVDRYERLPKITYRKALAEDNDDIIAMQEVEMPELRQELGDYYIAEEIMRQDPESEKSLLVVGETTNHEETEMSIFMWLTTDIDIEFYVHNYEVETFGNLVKSIEGRPFHYEALTVYSVNRRAPASMFTADALADLQATTILGGIQQIDSGMSVASAAKLRVGSIEGTIVEDTGADENNFYLREVLHTKFKYIIDKLTSNDYYMRHEPYFINFMYPTNGYPPGSKALEASSNVFVLKCIVARQDFALPRLFHSLVAMFCAYPDRDYCMMVLSKRNKTIRTHLEVLPYFMPVIARPTSLSGLDEVYITHRSTIFGEISIYEMRKEDVLVVRSLALGNLPERNFSFNVSPKASVSYCSKVNERAELDHELLVLDKIMKDVLENEFSEFSVFTIRCGNSTKSIELNTPIGYVVLRQFYSHSKLSAHYHLPNQEPRLDHLRAEIISLRLHPLFLVSSDQIFRDLAKKTNFFDFYFITSFHESNLGNDLKKMMMVLEPRPVKKAPVFFKSDREVDELPDPLNLPKHNFAKDYLIIYRHKLRPNKWFTNSKKLVIIGFTAMTKAFLRLLVFQWNSKNHNNAENYTCLSWPQVTVICRPGIMEAEYDNLFTCPYCPDKRGCYLSYQNMPCYIRDCCVRMDLRYWVHFVPGRVDSINRKRKFVQVNSCEIDYDSLLLMCARRFILKFPSTEGAITRPCNFMELNFRVDKLMLYYKLRALLESTPNTYFILVYGNNLSAYSCIAFLISHGIDSSRVLFIQPHRITGKNKVAKLKNPYWDDRLQIILNDILTDSGVTIREDYNFHHWILHESGDFIMQVVFQHFPSRNHVNFECDLFISFEEGYLSPRYRKFLQKADIALKGDDILVNERFQTNDPNIYAAGNYIKFPWECNYQYKFVSERETARKLLHHLDIAPIKNFEDRFSDPVHFQATLPLNYFITKITMPRRFLATQLPITHAINMTTYNNNTFCRVVLSQNMIVDEIVVVTKKECYFDFLQHFCGKHELLLNNLKFRHKAGMIKDFLMWFQNPWTELIMHESFEDLQAENRNILRTMALATQKKNVNHSPFQELTDRDIYLLNKQYIEQKLLSFLREHRGDFRNKFILPEDFITTDPFAWNRLMDSEADVTSETTEP